jgi:2-dehydropantoate 2-reductase
MQHEQVAVVGAGAVGCYFGGMLARAGVPVTLIGRKPHVEAIRNDGLFLERADFQEFVRLDADSEISAVNRAGIVLLSVKTVDTETAAAAIAPNLRKDAVLVSFQNGVDNVERIQRATGIRAMPAVVYVAAAMTGPGRIKHGGRGDLVVGEPSFGLDQPQSVQRVAQLFERAQIQCRTSPNIAVELWTKLVMNCAYNAISAVTQSRYLAIRENPLTQVVIQQLVEEVVAVGKAAGVALPNSEHLTAAALKLGEAMATATSSTAQDLARGRPTEIDSLNGYVSRRGKELGIPTPVNSTLHALVKILEDKIAREQKFE